MPLTDDEMAQIKAHINEKWHQSNCALCGANEWSASGVVQLVVAADTSTTANLLGGGFLPTAALVCKNCGNTVLMNLLVSGAIPQPSDDDDG